MQQNTKTPMRELDYGKLKDTRDINNLEREVRFTQKHKETALLHPWEQEMECLKVQTSDILMPMDTGDWFAGKLNRMFVGIDPERGDVVEPAFFCQLELLKEQLGNKNLDNKTINDIHFLLEYWSKEATYFRCREAFTEQISQALPSDDYYASEEISYPMFGFGGPILNYDKLLTLGLPGLEKEIREQMLQGDEESSDHQVFYKCLLGVIDLVKEMASRYEKEAVYKSKESNDVQIQNRFLKIANNLKNIQNQKPQNLHEAIQLFWLYNQISLTKNYGRMDVFLGDFLARDLETGELTKNQVLEMLIGLWQQIVKRGDNFNNRIIIGGKGRRNEKNADAFALLALEAQKTVNNSIPQLSLRYYKGINMQLWDKSFEVLSTGSTFPIIYNDDVNIPAVSKAFNVGIEEAEKYVPYGCGEYIIEHRSVGSPDAALNVLKALDVTLHNGIDSFSGKKMGLVLGNFKDFKDFDDFKTAFARQLEHQVQVLADAQATIYKTTVKYAAFPVLSLLYDDCISRGKPILGGGVRFLGGTIETFGNNSAADALYAIKKAVYDDKKISHDALLEMLKADFSGYEKEHKMLQSLPKFGNDLDEVDEFVVWIDRILGEAARIQKDYTILDNFLVVNINNGDSVLHGKNTAASADGRKAGQPLSNGNQPSAGNDANGITALLNSMAKVPAEYHAGMTHNIKFSRSTLIEKPEQVKALILGYFKNKGTQVMITSVNKDELESAMEHPEQYRHIFVRVGGYSERFVDLPKDIQKEILSRTLY